MLTVVTDSWNRLMDVADVIVCSLGWRLGQVLALSHHRPNHIQQHP